MKLKLLSRTSLIVLALSSIATAAAGGSDENIAGSRPRMPIQHVVIIFQENISFDHYFGTYPHAANPHGQPQFQAADDTPTINGLTGALLTKNPNSAQPFRLDRSQAVTCDQDHNYLDEQKAMNHGLMDKFVEFTEVSDPS